MSREIWNIERETSSPVLVSRMRRERRRDLPAGATSVQPLSTPFLPSFRLRNERSVFFLLFSTLFFLNGWTAENNCLNVSVFVKLSARNFHRRVSLFCLHKDCIDCIRNLFITLCAIIWLKFSNLFIEILYFPFWSYQSVIYFRVICKIRDDTVFVVIHFVYRLFVICLFINDDWKFEISNVSMVKNIQKVKGTLVQSIDGDWVCNFSKRCSLDWQSRRTSARERLSNFVRLRVIYSSNESRVSCVFGARPRIRLDSCPRSLNFRSFTFAALISLTQISVELYMKNYSLYLSNNKFFNNSHVYLLS